VHKFPLSLASLSCGGDQDAGTTHEVDWSWKGKYKVRFQVCGDRGPPIVLIHGLMLSRLVWEENMTLILAKAGYRIFALDLVGHGRSCRPDASQVHPLKLSPPMSMSSLDSMMDEDDFELHPATPPTDTVDSTFTHGGLFYCPETWSDLIADFVAEVIGEPAVLIGHSAGALSALLAGAKRPSLIQSIFCLNTTLRMDSPRRHSGLGKLGRALWQRFLHDSWMGSFMYDRLVNDNTAPLKIMTSALGAAAKAKPPERILSESLTKTLVQYWRAAGTSSFLLDTLTNASSILPEEALARIDAPISITFVWGADDPWENIDAAHALLFRQEFNFAAPITVHVPIPDQDQQDRVEQEEEEDPRSHPPPSPPPCSQHHEREPKANKERPVALDVVWKGLPPFAVGHWPLRGSRDHGGSNTNENNGTGMRPSRDPPQRRWIVLQNVGHFSNLEAAQELGSLILSILEEDLQIEEAQAEQGYEPLHGESSSSSSTIP